MFALGIAYARYGIPVSVSWRGFIRATDDDVEGGV
jgi:hypothetical protein